MTNIEIQFNRWINIIRVKASEYEHTARKKGETITQPDLDSVCNEMKALKDGFLAKAQQILAH